METNITKKLVKTPFTETTELLDDSDGIFYNPASAGLSLFENIRVVFQWATEDDSNHWPINAPFLNILAASELTFSNDTWQNLQKSLSNTVPLNSHCVQETNDYKPSQKNKLHLNTSDSASATKNGKFIYVTVPMFPFRVAAPNSCFKYKLNKKPLFPPLTRFKIIFQKQNKFPQKVLMDYSKVTTNDIVSNTTLADTKWQYGTTGAEWSCHAIKTKILDMKMYIERIIISQSDPLKDRKLFTYKYSYSRFVLSPITSHSSQQIELKWDINRLPISMEIFFLRDQDLLYDSSMKSPISINKFYIPPKLSEMELRYKHQNDKLFDNIKLSELNVNKINSSKMNYFNYLKLHSFISFTSSIEDYFSVNSTYGTGTMNIFPVDLTGRYLENSILMRGLILVLTFNNVLSSADIKWQVVIKYNYLKNIYLKRIPENIEVTIDPH